MASRTHPWRLDLALAVHRHQHKDVAEPMLADADLNLTALGTIGGAHHLVGRGEISDGPGGVVQIGYTGDPAFPERPHVLELGSPAHAIPHAFGLPAPFGLSGVQGRSSGPAGPATAYGARTGGSEFHPGTGSHPFLAPASLKMRHPK